jgi:hypothetical protein
VNLTSTTDRSACRAICAAVSEHGTTTGMDYTIVETAQRLAIGHHLDGATVELAISDGIRFLESFATHPTQEPPRRPKLRLLRS